MPSIPSQAPDPEAARAESEPSGPLRARPGSEAAERLMRTCPNCATELEERKCKLFCPRPGCGYFLSCADFY